MHNRTSTICLFWGFEVEPRDLGEIFDTY